MILKRITIDAGIGDDTNCYIIVDEKTKEAMVVDPGGEPEKIIDMIDVLEAKLKYIVITHCHGDHIGGVQKLKDVKGGKVLIHVQDAEGLNNPNINLGGIIGIDNINIELDSRLNDGDLLHIGEIEFKVIHTPGHTAGGICLYCQEEGLLISGDTVFRGTWGRTDLPTSSFSDIIHSITNKIMILPEETIVYPGHGKPTKIKEETAIYYGLKGKKY